MWQLAKVHHEKNYWISAFFNFLIVEECQKQNKNPQKNTLKIG
jgi:hypothetical protein